MAQHRRHRDDNGPAPQRRGISRGLLLGIIAVMIVVAMVVAWQHFAGKSDDEGTNAARSCVEGELPVPIVADPDIVEALNTVAAAFTRTNPVIRDHCIRVQVRAGDSKVTLEGLTGTWDAASMGDRPAAWIPQSTIWSAELTTAKPDAMEGTPTSLVTTPVVLAVQPDLGSTAKGTLQWSQLPTLQSSDGSLSTLGLPDIGSLRMAMPRGAQSDATSLAAQAVASTLTRSTGPLTGDDAALPRVASVVNALINGAPESQDGTATAALKAIGPDIGSSPVRAVPITEQKLYQLTKGDQKATVTEIVPGGPTPIADYPLIRLAGKQVSADASEGAAAFFDFLATPRQLAVLTALGFRGDAPLPKATATVKFPETPDPMPAPENEAAVTINRLIYGG
ncbi:MAG: substrate-binding domain-containing protein [Gordonia amarae]